MRRRRKGEREREEMAESHLLQVLLCLPVRERIERGNVELDTSVGSYREDSVIFERGRGGCVESEVGRHRGWWRREGG